MNGRARVICITQLCYCWFIGIAVLSVIEGCHKKQGNTEMKKWTHDSGRVSRVLPVLKEVETCAWREGVENDRSGGMVPGPSSQFIRGYAIVSGSTLESITTSYTWEESMLKPSELDLPEEVIGGLSGTLLESPSLVHTLPSISTYHNGRVVISPKNRFVYFDLIKD